MTDIIRLMPEAERLVALLPPLTLQVPKVAQTPVLGTHGRKKPGQGEAFWQYDEYRKGQHETSKIDWRRSAKTEDKTFVREYEWEAAQAAYIWCDNSPEMNFASGDHLQTKSDRAKTLTLALASALTAADERVALLGSEESLTNRVENIIGELTVRPDEDPQSWEKLGKTGRMPLTNSTVILISDCLEDPNVIREAIARLAERKVRGHIIQILDPAEVNLPYSGQILFEGFRGGQRELSKTEEMRREYYQKMHDHQHALLNICKRMGWNFSCHVTSQSGVDALAPLYNAMDGALPTFEDGADAVARKTGRAQKLWQRLRPGGPAP